MPREEYRLKGPIESIRKIAPIVADASSGPLGWEGLHALRFHETPSVELNRAPLPLHALVLTTKPPEKLELRYDGVKRSIPLPAGSVSIIPADSAAMWRWQGTKGSLHIYLEPSLVARVAKESFGLDPAQAIVPPLHGLDVPGLRNAMLAVNSELSARGAGGPLLVESLATVLAVHLVRYFTGRRLPEQESSALLPHRKLGMVIDYVMENLHLSPSLSQMAAVANLSPYHFSRQFKVITGLPPHQYVINRRVQRARELLCHEGDLTMAEIAERVGFCDQSQFCFHFKRIYGATPRQFQISARIP
jgi:AraC family transcriptional regulator